MRAPDRRPPARGATIVSVLGGDPKRVLIVEDDREVRKALAHALQLLGVEAALAVDGVDGLEQLHAGARPSLILLDLRMPRLGGEEFLDAIRADPELAHIPVVTMTASHDPSPARVQAHLPKPFHLRELHAAVRAAIAAI